MSEGEYQAFEAEIREMVFGDKTINELEKPLNKTNIKSREQGGRQVSYIEGWHAIAEANRIFNFQWSRETIYCKEISRIEVMIGKGDYKKPGFKVGYEAKVRVQVGDIVKEGTGHGSGTMSDLYDCIESAAKEAETDAMKRALMMFGNSFGLALYDKEKRGVEEYEPAPKPKPTVTTEISTEQKSRNWFMGRLLAIKTWDVFEEFLKNQKNKDARDALFAANQELSKEVEDAITAKKVELSKEQTL